MYNKQLYLNDQEWNKCVDSLKKIAAMLIHHEITMNEGVLEICILLHNFPDSIYENKNFLKFIGFSSETVHLPTRNSPSRKLWNKNSLLKTDHELEKIEAHYANGIIESCKFILNFDFDGFRRKLLSR